MSGIKNFHSRIRSTEPRHRGVLKHLRQSMSESKLGTVYHYNTTDFPKTLDL